MATGKQMVVGELLPKTLRELGCAEGKTLKLEQFYRLASTLDKEALPRVATTLLEQAGKIRIENDKVVLV